MATPDFVLELRAHVGTAPLWLPGTTAVIRDAEHRRVLLVRRADNGWWTPVTGIVDPGEPPAVAAEREVLEEAGIIAECEWLVSVDVVGPVVYPNGDRNSFVDTCFALCHVSGDPHPADGENTEAQWRTSAELPPMNERFTRVVRAALGSAGPARFTR